MADEVERISYRDQIDALLPDHTHREGPGIFDVFGGTTWTWTTPAGCWAVTWGGFGVGTLLTPYGRLELPGAPDVAFERLVGVLVALGGVEGGETS